MTNPILTITDQVLRTKLKESHLEQFQKDELSELIPHMSDNDRSQLLDLIEESHEVKAQEDKAGTKPQEVLKKLNQEYDQKMDQLVKTLSQKVRKEYEGLEKGKESKELKALEAEFK